MSQGGESAVGLRRGNRARRHTLAPPAAPQCRAESDRAGFRHTRSITARNGAESRRRTVQTSGRSRPMVLAGRCATLLPHAGCIYSLRTCSREGALLPGLMPPLLQSDLSPRNERLAALHDRSSLYEGEVSRRQVDLGHVVERQRIDPVADHDPCCGLYGICQDAGEAAQCGVPMEVDKVMGRAGCGKSP
jgi:hypothetical protein